MLASVHILSPFLHTQFLFICGSGDINHYYRTGNPDIMPKPDFG